MDIVDGHPAGLTELSIHMGDQAFHLTFQLVVERSVFAAGHNNQNQLNLAVKLWAVAQKSTESLNTLRNALGVVETVHTDRNLDLVCLGFDLLCLFLHFIRLRLARERVKIDADRERLNMSLVAGAEDRAA